MVELTEIKEESSSVHDTQEQVPIVDSVVAETRQDSEDLSDDEYDSDFEDDFNQDESVWERLAALKDIIPPKQRQHVSNLVQNTNRFVSTAFNKSGNLAWILTTSALLLGVPLSLSILAEQQLIEMEKSFDLQKDANDLLAQGDAAPAQVSA